MAYSWKVEFDEKSRKIFNKFSETVKEQILKYLQKVEQSNDPKAFGKSLVGDRKGIWRCRVGDYRILCEIINEELLILVIDVGHRREIYKKT
ncbi:MAG: type II toxin-antitoxin system RelE/ParE family toxin [Clostridiales Family XIII bacterium]|jgi:mRNA interferase RelE/StbE|nr:type II toxin-antitoxin system RelE/ParE family toxin [Clostridiales Family XIII bacterium]